MGIDALDCSHLNHKFPAISNGRNPLMSLGYKLYSKSFADTLKAVGVTAECVLYEGKTLTDLFLQDPMRGGIDDMLDDLITMIHGDNSETIRANSTPRKRLVPEFMLKMARSVSPF
ncbi:hypothetical protein K7X08_021334 [Anisodus acutangulus]|uniref:Uncharacterized protein n=1 Tax=Anisodus acutangulus TaxID=402998 RepID=A0A9Q1M0E0_9SOLA|nr:hypothetical protein K7X08_021334 [Anisodus acutangulus]